MPRRHRVSEGEPDEPTQTISSPPPPLPADRRPAARRRRRSPAGRQDLAALGMDADLHLQLPGDHQPLPGRPDQDRLLPRAARRRRAADLFRLRLLGRRRGRPHLPGADGLPVDRRLDLPDRLHRRSRLQPRLRPQPGPRPRQPEGGGDRLGRRPSAVGPGFPQGAGQPRRSQRRPVPGPPQRRPAVLLARRHRLGRAAPRHPGRLGGVRLQAEPRHPGGHQPAQPQGHGFHRPADRPARGLDAPGGRADRERTAQGRERPSPVRPGGRLRGADPQQLLQLEPGVLGGLRRQGQLRQQPGARRGGGRPRRAPAGGDRQLPGDGRPAELRPQRRRTPVGQFRDLFADLRPRARRRSRHLRHQRLLAALERRELPHALHRRGGPPHLPLPAGAGDHRLLPAGHQPLGRKPRSRGHAAVPGPALARLPDAPERPGGTTAAAR